MPTILRDGPYRLFFYSGDRDEPPHVHVERGTGHAKFWLQPVRLVESWGLRPPEIRRIERLVEDAREVLMRAWSEYFRD